MAQKKIIISFNRAPHGTAFYSEGLRAAAKGSMGLYQDHRVDIIFLGDGVFCALKGVDGTDLALYKETLAQHGSKLYCEEESIEAGGIDRRDLMDDIAVVPRSQVIRLYSEADISIAF